MKYTVEIVTKITLEIDAANTGAAIEKAGEMYWQYDPDEQNIRVVREEEVQ